MRNIASLEIVRKCGIASLLSLLLFVFGSTANAQCGTSFEAMMTTAALARTRSKILAPTLDVKSKASAEQFSDKAVNPSIVGLWHIGFYVDTPDGPLRIQEAFQIWNTGGTEVHNPNVDPRGGSVCLGSWVEVAPQTFKLTHRVWLYDTSGNLQAIGHLTETLTLGDRGNTHGGTFTLQAFDPDGNPLGDPAVGMVVGERITPN